MKLNDVILRDITERLNGKEISAAKALGPVAKMASNSTTPGFSTKGLPGYLCGKRDADTVVVNLNPGIDAGLADCMWVTNTLKFDSSTPQTFINDLLRESRDYGINDAGRYDEFDIKQAAFFTPWKNSGIGLPANTDWGNKCACLKAKKAVLCNKLQLELVPYASSKFAINKNSIVLFHPFVDTLLDEIFSKKREYVVFASALFEDIFKSYNKKHPGTFVFLSKSRTYSKAPLKSGGIIKGSCKLISIEFQGKKQKALIAYTFPSQALGHAFSLMQKYGQFCYDEYVKTATP